jgi:hypothetical protein
MAAQSSAILFLGFDFFLTQAATAIDLESGFLIVPRDLADPDRT